ncbi:MAG: type IV secretion protein DotH [Alphaproteobacteria bacterium]|nr:type IV secretion protein DotH [Alphaproteobacteria bacterium]
MTKFYFFRIQMVILMVVLVCVGGTSQAQTPSVSETPTETPTQTLMQEAPAAADPQPDSKASAPEADAPPSLADYLSKTAGTNDSGESSSSAPSNPAATPSGAAPTMDMNALVQGGAPPLEVSPEVAKAEADASIRKEAFGIASDQLMPLKPNEIRRMLELYDETKQASETPVYPTPEPESSFQGISLDPGSKPLVIKTAIGNVTTVSIVDLTGQPWPIQDLTWAGDFQIEQPESGSHMLRITPTSEFAGGNVSMRLLGLNPPVIFTLKAERKTVHVRLDVQIPEIGPKGVLPPMEVPVSTKAGDDFMTSVLVGVVKGKDTTQLKVDGIDGRTTAFSKGGMLYVRTPYTMLSPAWSSSVQSGDGTKVYALNFSPVILLSDKGKMVRAYLSHKETSDEQY